MSRIFIVLICLFSIAIASSCNRDEADKTVVGEKKVEQKVEKNAKPEKIKAKEKAKKNNKPKKEYFIGGKKRPRHYVDGIAEKLELTDTERDRLYLIYKTYHFKKQYAESDEEYERYNDMMQEAFQNIVGYDKYQKFLELRDEGGI